MTTWYNYNMWLVKTEDNLGEMSNMPVIVFDQGDDADKYIKELEHETHKFFGDFPIRIWRKIPIRVSLNAKHFQPNESQESKN